ncbi:bZIP 2 domain containing protein [Asbolus verrucosus]|uniref:BZIP 2 domain containing protein n=1 Tax=Asbolus verrucosus TaxID=1661398 RepID=A0A482VFT8_ASBVE|nr:bZIP 2 domain containing protein [Asbolus verrucosus]
MEYSRTHDTQFLLKEFETVYDVVEFAHETLTPPQSPPSEKPIFTTLEPLLTQPTYANLPEKHQVTYPVPEKQLLPNVLAYRALTPVNIPTEYPSAITPQPDIAHELAVVDELVRTRVEDMQWSSGPSSPNSSSSSNFGDCSSDDPEWMPEPVENYDNPTASPKTPRKRSKPYSRTGTVDKKSRKKEQNKNAATRYRMKKKAEVEVILSEEKQLSMKNEDLEGKISDMQREIKYLKGLMRDLFKAKGLIN